MNKQNEILLELVRRIQDVLMCPVVKANQTNQKIPPYPYVSFTVITPMVANGGTWGKHEDGYERKPFKQVWSFTAQSDDDTRALEVAMNLYEFLDRKNDELSEKGIVVERLSNIANRDNFITIQYEHRYGFDVTFSFMREGTDIVKAPDLVSVEIKYKKGDE